MNRKDSQSSGRSHVSAYEVIWQDDQQVKLEFLIKKGALKIILVNECKETENTYELVYGEMFSFQTQETFKAGDRLVYKNIHEDIVLDVLEDTLVKWTTSRAIYDDLDDQSQMIMTILDEIQLKDAYTKEHTLRVTSLAKRLALALGLTGQEIADISLAALSHDVGKIKVSDTLLNKPAKLTFDEYNLMKKHAEDSYNFIRDRYSDSVKEIVLQHHERLDGSGYPNALVEEQICIGARVLAIADSYDAMTTDRPYKKGWDHSKAFEELRRESGRLFELNMVETFIEHINEISKGVME